jgi:hypothetical protein
VLGYRLFPFVGYPLGQPLSFARRPFGKYKNGQSQSVRQLQLLHRSRRLPPAIAHQHQSVAPAQKLKRSLYPDFIGGRVLKKASVGVRAQGGCPQLPNFE